MVFDQLLKTLLDILYVILQYPCNTDIETEIKLKKKRKIGNARTFVTF